MNINYSMVFKTVKTTTSKKQFKNYLLEGFLNFLEQKITKNFWLGKSQSNWQIQEDKLKLLYMRQL